jgi:hypothetical protein
MCYNCGNCAAGFHEPTIDDSMDKVLDMGFLWKSATNASTNLNTDFAIKKTVRASVRG